jgi:hypothetical protein
MPTLVLHAPLELDHDRLAGELVEERLGVDGRGLIFLFLVCDLVGGGGVSRCARGAEAMRPRAQLHHYAQQQTAQRSSKCAQRRRFSSAKHRQHRCLRGAFCSRQRSPSVAAATRKTLTAAILGRRGCSRCCVLLGFYARKSFSFLSSATQSVSVWNTAMGRQKMIWQCAFLVQSLEIL